MTARALLSRLRALLVHVAPARTYTLNRRWADQPAPDRMAMVPGNSDQEVIYRLLLESGTAETARHA